MSIGHVQNEVLRIKLQGGTLEPIYKMEQKAH
jgi:hypothetical protein